MEKQTKEQRPRSKLDRFKYIGYCQSSLPPEGVELTYEDFLTYAKFQLCMEKRILMKDPIWDRYGDEEILIEYFGMLFEKNEDAKKAFETSMTGSSASDDEFSAWADRQIADERKRDEGKGEELEEFSFSPEDLGE